MSSSVDLRYDLRALPEWFRPVDWSPFDGDAGKSFLISMGIWGCHMCWCSEGERPKRHADLSPFDGYRLDFMLSLKRKSYRTKFRHYGKR